MNVQTAIANENEFCGNPYFKKESDQLEITVDVFAEKYYNPFIETILTHAT
jgi:hypothetical protein